MKGNIVFDIDSVIAVPNFKFDGERMTEEEMREKFGQAYMDKHLLTAIDYPHAIWPGYYALFVWLHERGYKLHFFSSAVRERNEELVPKLMEIAFAGRGEVPKVPIWSRNHGLDTERFQHRDEGRDKFMGAWFGNLKKVLTDVVVPASEMDNTLIIEDDSSYIVKGEERNLIKLKWNSSYFPGDYGTVPYMVFHKSYYLAGLIEELERLSEEYSWPLTEAAYHVQLEREGMDNYKECYYYGSQRVQYYERGYELLKAIDPELKIYYPLVEKEEEIW